MPNEPQRGRLLTLEELVREAGELAQSIKGAVGWRVPPQPLLRVLVSEAEELDDIHRTLSDLQAQGKTITPSAEWIVDNIGLIREQIKAVSDYLPHSYYSDLPRIEEGNYAGFPRVFALSVELVRHQDAQVTWENLHRFVTSFQETMSLTIGELWALPLMLRIALLRALMRLARRVRRTHDFRQKADEWAHLIHSATEAGGDRLLQLRAQHAAQQEVTALYVAELLQQVRETGALAADVMDWLEEEAAALGVTLEQATAELHQRYARQQVAVANTITSLRALSRIDWQEFFEQHSQVESVLREDPAGIYPRQDFATRNRYRVVVERLSRGLQRGRSTPVDERFVAQRAIQLASAADDSGDDHSRKRHVGYYLIGPGRAQLEAELSVTPPLPERLTRFIKTYPLPIYLSAVAAATLALIAAPLAYAARWSAPWWMLMMVAAVTALPAADLAINVVNWAVLKLAHPRPLPKLELANGIPPELRTMVVIPTLLNSRERVEELLAQLEVHYVANQYPHVHFALLGDLADADAETKPGDRAILDAAVRGMRELNARHATRGEDVFYFFHRPRQWNAAEGKWMGWERKRGNLMQFNDLLRSPESDAYCIKEGDLSVLPQVRYVITLDADTRLSRDAARRLIGCMAHPLNRPVIDPERRIVIDGYAIMQPRVAVDVRSATRTMFAFTFSGQKGVDPYTTAVSDLYQDLFGQGIFTGKGIYDVDAFETCLEGRFPENLILSHDLIECAHARAALVTDVEVLDDYPASYLAHAKRLHRWVRGDWQIAPWLFPRVRNAAGERVANPIPGLCRWQIFDNLRRSLTTSSLLLLVVVGVALPGRPLVWLLAALIAIAFPIYAHLADAMLLKPRGVPLLGHFSRTLTEGAELSRQTVISLLFLPHQAWTMLDAITRTLWRMTVSHRLMLEWQTAADVEGRLKGTVRECLGEMWPAPATAFAYVVLSLMVAPDSWWESAIISALWLLSPVSAHRLSQVEAPDVEPASPQARRELRRVARQTWRFFETFMNEENRWLPPDNIQDDPELRVAHRTSPTNIGLGLLSVVAARDLGFIGVVEMVDRLERTLATVRSLERVRGHLLNWYDTRTGDPLGGRYVSSVDSGNFVGYLMTLEQVIAETPGMALYDPSMVTALEDTLGLVAADSGLEQVLTTVNEFARDSATPAEWRALLARLHETLPHDGTPADTETIEPWQTTLARSVAVQLRNLDSLLPWLRLMPVPPVLRNAESGIPAELVDDLERCLDANSIDEALEAGPAARNTLSRILRRLDDADAPGGVRETVTSWAGDLDQALAAGEEALRELMDRLRAIAGWCEELVRETDFRLLYDDAVHLFHIGYLDDIATPDSGYYDLLASEARQTSFVAIAKGDVPSKHWFRLGRSFTNVGPRKCLLSWSGTMFEYLMPALILRHFEHTLLGETLHAAVGSHRHHVVSTQRLRAMNLPWGISESAYNLRGSNSDYQYRAFGASAIGFKRGLEEDIVVAPYACLLAAPLAPTSVVDNLARFRELGAEGPFGFYEACDFTGGRLPQGQKCAVVRCLMSHHQGMILMALDNCLNNNVMPARFHRDPRVRATEMLLQERVPRGETAMQPTGDPKQAERALQRRLVTFRRVLTNPHSAAVDAHMLSNGAYSVAVTAAGGGFSRWNEMDVNRWREDPTCDAWGQFIYIRDLHSGEVISATCQPIPEGDYEYEVSFTPEQASFRRETTDLRIETDICVSSEDDAEVRMLRLRNLSRRARTLDVTTYFEPVLAAHAADRAHPAFSNLFVQTEFDDDARSLFCTRRPRHAEQDTPWLMHSLVTDECGEGPLQVETDRARFLGRLGDVHSPRALRHGEDLSHTTGAVVDPCASLRRRLVIPPGSQARVAVVTGMASDRKSITEMAARYRDIYASQRAFKMAWTFNHVELQYMGLTARRAEALQQWGARLLYQSPIARRDEAAKRQNRGGQADLWPHGVSGDLPIVLVRVHEPEQNELVKEALTAHEFWRRRGFRVDLVLLNEAPPRYIDEVDNAISDLVRSTPAHALLGRPGGVFLLQSHHMTEETRVLFRAVARIVLNGPDGALSEQLSAALPLPAEPPPLEPDSESPPPEQSVQPSPAPQPTQFDNGFGGFSEDGREYIIHVSPESVTPAPWINVVANPDAGFLVSESGGGYSWAANSRQNKLTEWSNDPVGDPPSEAFYLRDDATGEFWSPTPRPRPDDHPYTVRHGFGYSVFHHLHGAIESELTLFMPISGPVKIHLMRLRNHGERERRLSVFWHARLALGETPEQNLGHIVTSVDEEAGMLMAANPYSDGFAERTAFVVVSEPDPTFSGSRMEFIGRNRSLRNPAALERQCLSGVVGAGLDPCAAAQMSLSLAPGEERDIVLLFGQTESLEQALRLRHYADPDTARKALSNARDWWRRRLSSVQVETPDHALNLIVNGWLLYQVLSCRYWARSAFYQSGGAYGYRDQLQDVGALALTAPQITREHIIRSAARQFLQGDVQHWWHPHPDRGIRTRCSDDLLWLPFIVAHYIAATGDRAILDIMAPFLESDPLRPDEMERYAFAQTSTTTATIYDHCVAALDRALTVGEHGLPLMGTCDWNDGMDRIGHQGRGESVWMAWFLYACLDRFLPYCEARGDAKRVQRYREHMANLRQAAETSAWDGNWYRRAFDDDGRIYGSADNDECKIDAIAQSWSVISGAAPPQRARQAMASLEEHLVRREDGLILLLTPPFDKSDLDPGYIKGYIPGVRENGGQYTHAAAWAVLAFALLGEGDKAGELYAMLNPIHHADTREAAERYKVEPYVVAADIYGAPPHVGRGGWTWYTGSAGWMFRVALEGIAGLRVDGDRMTLQPCIPSDWDGYRLTWRREQAAYHIEVINPDHVSTGVARVELNGEPQPDGWVRLGSEGKHNVRVVMGAATKDDSQT